MVRSEATSVTHTKTRQRKEKLRIKAMKRPLDRQEIAYRKASVVIDESYDNLNESGDIFNFFRENKVKIIKFNNTFDKSVQNQASYDGFMQIQDSELVITLKKPTVEPEFVMDADNEAVMKAKEAHREKMNQTIRQLAIEKKVNIINDEGIQNEVMLNEEVNKMKLYKLDKSSLSCSLDEITSFQLGGITSRFWVMRKHLNLMTNSEIDKAGLPFYSWQCIPLCQATRKIFLVI